MFMAKAILFAWVSLFPQKNDMPYIYIHTYTHTYIYLFRMSCRYIILLNVRDSHLKVHGTFSTGLLSTQKPFILLIKFSYS